MADNNTELRSDVQHGLDDNPHNDAEKAAALGGLGGAAVGAVAGSAVGPVGTLVGAIAGGLLGAGASGLAVGAVDQVDNDNTVSGIGDGTTSADVDPLIASPGTNRTVDNENIRMSRDTTVSETGIGGHNVVTGEAATTNAGNTGLAAGAIAGGLLGTAVGGPVGAVVGGTLGALAGGVAGDAVEAADDETALGDSGVTPALSSDEDWNANREAIDDINRSNAIPLGPSTADALGATDTPRNQFDDDRGNSADSDYGDSRISTPQTDYRAVDEGLTSLGATDTNADVAISDDLGTAGVRSTNFDLETQAHGSTLETDAWKEDFTNPQVNNDAPGIHPENMTTAGAINGREAATDHFLSGDDRDEKTRGDFNNTTTSVTDVVSGTASGDYERGAHTSGQTEHPADEKSR